MYVCRISAWRISDALFFDRINSHSALTDSVFLMRNAFEVMTTSLKELAALLKFLANEY